MSASPITIATFCLLVLVVLGAVLGAIRRAHWPVTVAVGVVLAYLVVPAALTRAGLLDRYTPLPAPALLLFLGLTLLSIILISSRLGAALATAVPVGILVGFQAFRIVVEALLHRLSGEGVIPVQMTYAGRNFDVLTGLTGLALGLWLLRGGKPSKTLLLGWNLLGLGLLANIVAVAVLSTPVPFRHFTDGPPNLLPSTLPFVWLPSFLVQVALGSHLLVFRQVKALAAG